MLIGVCTQILWWKHDRNTLLIPAYLQQRRVVSGYMLDSVTVGGGTTSCSWSDGHIDSSCRANEVQYASIRSPDRPLLPNWQLWQSSSRCCMSTNPNLLVQLSASDWGSITLSNSVKGLLKTFCRGSNLTWKSSFSKTANHVWLWSSSGGLKHDASRHGRPFCADLNHQFQALSEFFSLLIK